VSVVIATYEGDATLAAQLDALSKQTFARPWELVVADNMGSATTRALVDEQVRVIPGIRYVDASQKRGVAFARNTGAKAARGELLLFCDDDDLVSPTWIDALVTAAETEGADLVGGRRDVTVLNTPEARYWRGVPDGFDARFGGPPHAVGSNVAVRREMFERVGGFDEAFTLGGEDVDLGIRVAAAGGRLAFAEEATIEYRLKDTPGAVGRQSYAYGRSEPLLFRKHPDQWPRRRATVVLKSWGWMLVNVWRVVPRRERGRWLWIAGRNVGRIAGSFHERVFYP
jgi:GT2 family glycosyltransferase